MARSHGAAGAPIAGRLVPEGVPMRELLVEFVRPGESDLSGRSLWRAGQLVLSVVITVTNVIGACSVLAIAYLVVPLPSVENVGHVRVVNAIVAAVYVAVAVPVGAFVGTRSLLGLRRWLIEERAATPDEQRTVLHAPLRLSLMQLGWWVVAAFLFGGLNTVYSGILGLR